MFWNELINQLQLNGFEMVSKQPHSTSDRSLSDAEEQERDEYTYRQRWMEVQLRKL